MNAGDGIGGEHAICHLRYFGTDRSNPSDVAVYLFGFSRASQRHCQTAVEPATERIGWDSEIPTSGATRRAPRRIAKRRITKAARGNPGGLSHISRSRRPGLGGLFRTTAAQTFPLRRLDCDQADANWAYSRSRLPIWRRVPTAMRMRLEFVCMPRVRNVGKHRTTGASDERGVEHPSAAPKSAFTRARHSARGPRYRTGS
jgi:hypothetical protein